MMNFYYRAWGAYAVLRYAPKDERGLSQSTENAILLTGAVAIALAVIAVMSGYVNGKLETLR